MIVDFLNTKCHYPLVKGEYYIYDDLGDVFQLCR